jgi:inhibitor of cysteine peptidase
MIRKLAGIMVVIAVTVLAGCADRQPVHLKVDRDTAVTIEKEQVVEVALEANPTTGYTWQVELSQQAGSVRRLGEGKYKSSADRIGSGGIMSYRFEGVQRGQAIVVFKYLRTWEKGIAPVKTYNLTITVR